MLKINKISFKLIVIVVLVACLLCSCQMGQSINKTTSNSSQQQSTENLVNNLTLLYCDTDKLDPYQRKTELNKQIVSLMFDPLIKLDNNFVPQKVLADTVVLTDKTCTVTLKNATFSDGSPVTAQDVLFSAEKAKKSETLYASRFVDVKSVVAVDEFTVQFNLTKQDLFFENQLDFPIIKAGTDNLVDSNNIWLPPIGSGRYVFSQDNTALLSNENYLLGAPKIKKILLVHVPDKEAIEYNIKTNIASCFYSSLENGQIPNMTGNAKKVNLNNLVYVGVNMNNQLLDSYEMRFAISSAINRTELINSSFYGYATQASGLFPASWTPAVGLQLLNLQENAEQVIANLNSLGYNRKDNKGFYVNSNSKKLSFKLIYCVDNPSKQRLAELLKTQMETAGIELVLNGLTFEQYNANLVAGDFDLYLGEVVLPNNMDISQLVCEGGILTYGQKFSNSQPVGQPSEDGDINEADTTLYSLNQYVNGFYKGENTLSDVLNAFNSELPVIPLCHRSGVVVYSSKIEVTETATMGDAYYGLEKYTFK